MCGFDTSQVTTGITNPPFKVTYSFTNEFELSASLTRTITVKKNCNYAQPLTPGEAVQVDLTL